MLQGARLRPGEGTRSAREARWWWRLATLLVLSGACGLSFGVFSLVAAREAARALPVQASTEPSAGNPLRTLVRVDADALPLVGQVEERLRAGSYAYHAIRLDRDGSRAWAVTLGEGHPRGAHVHVTSFGRRRDFHSRRLNRTFPELIFGIVSRSE